MWKKILEKERDVGGRPTGRLTNATFILTWVLIFFFPFQTCLAHSAPFLWTPTRRCFRFVAISWASATLLWADPV